MRRDFNSLVEIFSQAKNWKNAVAREEIEEVMEDPYFNFQDLFVAEDSGKVVGFAHGYLDPRVVMRLGYKLGFIGGIFTVSEYQGLADRELLKSTLQVLRNKGSREVEYPSWTVGFASGISVEKDSYLYRLFTDFGFEVSTMDFRLSRSLDDYEETSELVELENMLRNKGFVIRRAKKQDAEEIVKVRDSSYKDAYDYVPMLNDDFRRKVSQFKPENYVIATFKQRIVGFGGAIAKDSWISDLGVLPKYRGRGLGTLLFHKVIMNLKKKRARKARLSVVGINYPAVRIYRKQGFQVDSVLYGLRKKF